MVHNRPRSGVNLCDTVTSRKRYSPHQLSRGAAMADDVDEQRAERHDPGHAPGGRAAVDRGCTCSVLANAAYRAGAPDEQPFVDPRCPVHTAAS
jgi:hypothetical protein